MRASVNPCCFHSTRPAAVCRVWRTQGSPPHTPADVCIQLFVTVFSVDTARLSSGLLPRGSNQSCGLTVVGREQPTTPLAALEGDLTRCTAACLGFRRTTLLSKMEKLGISRPP